MVFPRSGGRLPSEFVSGREIRSEVMIIPNAKWRNRRKVLSEKRNVRGALWTASANASSPLNVVKPFEEF
jgi:hypothetical protein